MHRSFPILALLLLAIAAGPALADDRSATSDTGRIEPHVLPALDVEAALLADERRAVAGEVPHYALPVEVAIDPWGDAGSWQVLANGEARWRLRLVSPGALSINLAFNAFRLPPGARLELISAAGHRVGPFTARDNEDHGQLWTPPVPAGDLMLELRLPIDEIDALELELARVHQGYAGFGERGPRAGSCHRDVACPEAEPWADAARSVALISVAGVRFCTGFLVNNTALDGRPLMITAGHCGVTRDNAPSVVVLWNHQRESCGGEAAGLPVDLRQFQTGAIWRAAYRPTDTLLLELDDSPEAFGIYYAGWDRSPADPARSTAIHHPNTGAKRISFDFDQAATTAHLRAEPWPGGNHLRIGEWDLGSTEGGSSGAPLFNGDRRVVGQLRGGYAACGEPRADWFGRLSAAWAGHGRPGGRLSDWLDPLDTGAMTLDGLDGAEVGARGLEPGAGD